MKKLAALLVVVAVLASFVGGCAAPTPEVVEKEVVVEKPVVQTVVVEKEKVVEKEVVKTVVVEKEVPVEKIVEKPVEKVVEKVVTPTPVPAKIKGTIRVGSWESGGALEPWNNCLLYTSPSPRD